ncbi:MAG: prepilin peptidase [Desulfotignum sp.]|nr:prepilin peptidase [Desulfotignum sp.]
MSYPLLVILILLFIFGACVGSFLNVCIYRIPRKKSIVSPGSACPACNTPIPSFANIPLVSFLVLKGRCLFCSHPISWRYPLVEAVTGLAAVLVFLRFGLTQQAAVWFGFFATLLVVSVIDLDFQIIPDCISLPGIAVFAVLAHLVLDRPLSSIGYGILAGGGILYAVALVYYLVRKTDGMGGGDIKLLAMIGAATGVSGVLFTLFAGSVFGTVAGAAQMVRARTRDRLTRIPFGPYLSAGAVLYLFYGDMIIQWYIFTIINL